MNFQNPPESAKPRTWWHWTGGNVIREGITKDLEWMKRVGIAGFQLADVSYGGGQDVENKVLFGTQEWLDLVQHSAQEAERLNLEMAIFSSAGWSLTGGPWVTPEQAMKKIVYSDTLIKGPAVFKSKLPHPPFNNGPIQNLGRPTDDPTFYKDIAVLAYKVDDSFSKMMKFNPKISSSSGPIDATTLFDGDLNSVLTIEAPANGNPAWIQFEFDELFSARAFTISAAKGIPLGRLLASRDGEEFTTILTLPGKQLYRQGWQRTFSFPEVKAKYFRVEFTAAPLRPAETMLQAEPQPAKEYTLSELVLHSEPRINRWEEKVGFRHLFEYESVPTPHVSENAVIQPNEMIDLTSRLDANGYLDWNVPEGNWQILRLGYSLTGAKNRPAMKTGLGFEVDKLSSKHTKSYLEEYLKPISKVLGPLYGKSLKYVLLDSWEAGMQNWTDDMVLEFKERRGYDPKPYLPALAGRIVASAEVSDRFLWDFRRTIVDMFAENHYGTISKYLKKQGIGTYGEASGVSLEILEDALLCKKNMDIPMGEFWFRSLHPELMYYQDIRGAASAAHVYGKKIVAAEAFTGGNYESPFSLKKVADYWFCQGVNRLVFHTSAHQPLDTKPGNTMVGTHLNRNITWAEQAKPFNDYLARTSFMLQQGKSVADIVYLLNEGAPSTMPIWGAGLLPKPPVGYDFDYINTDVLLNRISVNEKGDLVLPDGVKYRILVLPQTDQMTVPVLEKIHDLVLNGATVVGAKPIKSPSLLNYPECDLQVQKIASDLWGDLDGISKFRRYVGKGKVIWGMPLAEVLKANYVLQDVDYSKPLDTELYWVHRQTAERDIYFIVNNSETATNFDIRFRVKDKIPEVWYAGEGTQKFVKYYNEKNTTKVSLSLPCYGSAFVVFGNNSQANFLSESNMNDAVSKTILENWQIEFPVKSGAPDKIETKELKSWTEFCDTGVVYFSGTASYKNNFIAPQNWFQNGHKLILDLGDVFDISEVSLNGQSLGVCWKPPYQYEITPYLKLGANHLEIKITNQWTNRLIGDRDSDIKHKVLSAGSENIRFFGPKPELQKSGLLGPVKILSVEK